jgi:uncharacterized protein (TIGR03437 family)
MHPKPVNTAFGSLSGGQNAPDPSKIAYSSVFGGSGGHDIANAVAVDSAFNIYLAGETFSNDFPTTQGAFQRTFNGIDGFVAKVNLGPIVNVAVNSATNQQGIVPGSWLTIYGVNLADTAMDWSSADFSKGLPTTLGGVQVSINGQAAAIYYLSPTQINAQAPSGINSNVSVQVIHNGLASNIVTATGVQHAPGLFAYTLDSKTFYPSAVFLDGTIVGDPAVAGGTRKAKPGDRILLFATGLGPSPSGVLIPTPVAFGDPVAVMIGSTPATVEFTGLVAVGEFQINIVVPNLPPGNYPIVLQTDATSSQAGVVLPIGN